MSVVDRVAPLRTLAEEDEDISPVMFRVPALTVVVLL